MLWVFISLDCHLSITAVHSLSVTCCMFIKPLYVLVSIAFLVKTLFLYISCRFVLMHACGVYFCFVSFYLFPYFLLLFGFQMIKGIKEFLMKPYQDLTMFPIILPHHDGLSLRHIMLSSRTTFLGFLFPFILLEFLIIGP